MTLKNKIESRIRGWFPQEPQFTKAVVLGKMSEVYPPIEQYLITSYSVTKNTSIFAVCFGVSGCLGLFIAMLFGNYAYRIADLFWVIAGITVGSLTGLWSAQGQLRQLARTNQVSIYGRHFKSETAVMLLFAFAAIFLVFQIHAMFTMFSPVALMVAASYCSKYLIFKGYEKIRKVTIRQQKLSPYVMDPLVYALPIQRGHNR